MGWIKCECYDNGMKKSQTIQHTHTYEDMHIHITLMHRQRK